MTTTNKPILSGSPKQKKILYFLAFPFILIMLGAAIMDLKNNADLMFSSNTTKGKVTNKVDRSARGASGSTISQYDYTVNVNEGDLKNTAYLLSSGNEYAFGEDIEIKVVPGQTAATEVTSIGVGGRVVRDILFAAAMLIGALALLTIVPLKLFRKA